MSLSLSPAARENVTELLICFSLGNLCFLRRWYDLEHLQSRSVDYFRSGPPDQTLLYATLLCSALLTMVLWLLWMFHSFLTEVHASPSFATPLYA